MQTPSNSNSQPDAQDPMEMGEWLTPPPSGDTVPGDVPTPPYSTVESASNADLYENASQQQAAPPAMPTAPYANVKSFAKIASLCAGVLILGALWGLQGSVGSYGELRKLADQNIEIKKHNLKVNKQNSPMARAQRAQVAVRQITQRQMQMVNQVNQQVMRQQEMHERMASGEPASEQEMAAYEQQMSRPPMISMPAKTMSNLMGLSSDLPLKETMDDRHFAAGQISASRMPVMLGMLVFVAGFLAWKFHAVQNLPALNIERVTMTPGGAIGAWAMPAVNLIAPLIVMQDLCRSSRQENLLATYNNRKSRSGIIVGWWACMVLGGLTLIWSYSRMFGAAGPEEMLSAVQMSLFADVMLGAAAGLGAYVALMITEDQQQRREALIAWTSQPAQQTSPAPPQWRAGVAQTTGAYQS